MKNFFCALLFSFFPFFPFSEQRKTFNLLCTKNNIIPKSIELIISKKTFKQNNGTDARFILDETMELNKIIILKQNLEKKKILDFLQDNNTCIYSKMKLIENNSYLFYKEKGLKKNFDEFLTS